MRLVVEAGMERLPDRAGICRPGTARCYRSDRSGSLDTRAICHCSDQFPIPAEVHLDRDLSEQALPKYIAGLGANY